jgi:predicted amidohydrolase
MAKYVKIAGIQFQGQLGCVAENTRHAVSLIQEAAAQGAKIICLPEMFSTGYHLPTLGDRFGHLAQTTEGETITALRQVARENGVYVIAPIVLQKAMPGVVYNSAVCIDDQGEIAGVYDKNHLCGGEKLYFAKGHEYPVFDTPYGRVGIMICYDAGFPEVARILALKGVEILLCPSAWCYPDLDLWMLNMPAWALENSLYLMAVNRVGQEGADLRLAGCSLFCDPRGHILGQLDTEHEGILYGEVDPDRIIDQRSELPYLRDRCPAEYGVLTAPHELHP